MPEDCHYAGPDRGDICGPRQSRDKATGDYIVTIYVGGEWATVHLVANQGVVGGRQTEDKRV